MNQFKATVKVNCYKWSFNLQSMSVKPLKYAWAVMRQDPNGNMMVYEYGFTISEQAAQILGRDTCAFWEEYSKKPDLESGLGVCKWWYVVVPAEQLPAPKGGR